VIFHCPFCSLHASSRVSLSATPTRWTNVPVPPRGAVGRGLSRSRARTCLADARPRTRGGGGDEENTQLWPLPPPSARASPAVRAFSFSSTAPWLTRHPRSRPPDHHPHSTCRARLASSFWTSSCLSSESLVVHAHQHARSSPWQPAVERCLCREQRAESARWLFSSLRASFLAAIEA